MPMTSLFPPLAVVNQADYLVTGDQDLPGLAGQIARPIVTAEAFLKILNP
jgi:predicted nucleic acid-binding protein